MSVTILAQTLWVHWLILQIINVGMAERGHVAFTLPLLQLDSAICETLTYTKDVTYCAYFADYGRLILLPMLSVVSDVHIWLALSPKNVSQNHKSIFGHGCDD